MNTLKHGDCLQVMREMADASVDAIVTDPPAGIAFMGKSWDNPRNYPISGFGLSDGGKRLPAPTIGRSSRNGTCQKCGRRERGWKDVLPCSCPEPDFNEPDRAKRDRDFFIAFLADVMAECLRVAKPGSRALVWAIPRTSHWTGTAIEDAGWIIEDRISHLFGQGFPKGKSRLKPACEDWWLARKPSRAVPPLNIDDCRIASGSPVQVAAGNLGGYGGGRGGDYELGIGRQYSDAGRWPANLVLSHLPGCVQCGTRLVRSDGHFPKSRTLYTKGEAIYGAGSGLPVGTGRDESYMGSDGRETVESWKCVEGCPVAMLDEQSGMSRSRVGKPRSSAKPGNGYGMTHTGAEYEDSGGRSRFFYCSKATREDRGEGNDHPTVKPHELMRWLIRLISGPGDVILDPFMGSGSTGKAAVVEGRDFIGIEAEEHDFRTAERRIKEAEGCKADPLAPPLDKSPGKREPCRKPRMPTPPEAPPSVKSLRQLDLFV